MPYPDKTRKGWRGQVTRSGKRKTCLCKNKREALQWEARQRGMPLDDFLTEIGMGYSLAEWAEEYLNHAQKRFSRNTYLEKRKAFMELFRHESIPVKGYPEDLTPGILLKHFEEQAEKRSGNAANKDRKNLMAAWNWASKYLKGWSYTTNPFKSVDSQVHVEHRRYIPPVDDFWKVYDHVTGQDKVLLLTFLHTAARRNEIFNLTWFDVDFSRRLIRLTTKKRKNAQEADWLPLTDELHDALFWWKSNRTFPEVEHVFVCEESTPFCREYYMKPFEQRRHWLGRVCERVGVEPFGFHAIRHLSASILDDAGYPLTVIQALLRHKSAMTTARYLHKLRGMKVSLDAAFVRKSHTGNLGNCQEWQNVSNGEKSG